MKSLPLSLSLFAAISLLAAVNPLGAQLPPPTNLSCSSNPSNSTCNGQDPGQQGCDLDEIKLAEGNIVSTSNANLVLGRIVIRYSPKCQSAWARTVVNEGSGSANLLARILRTDGVQFFASKNSTAVRTPMVFLPRSSNLAVTAEGRINNNGLGFAGAKAPN